MQEVEKLIIELTVRREEQGLSQRALAIKLGVRACQVYRWEEFIQNPNLLNLLKWCNALGIELSWSAST